MSDVTRACPICRRPYKLYSHTVADQSACPSCVSEAERNTKKPDTEAEILRRQRFFGRQ